MKKKKKKERHEDCGHEVDSINNVYMFHNLKFNLHLFINAMDLDDAMNQFDMCQFENRKYWKVFLETAGSTSANRTTLAVSSPSSRTCGIVLVSPLGSRL